MWIYREKLTSTQGEVAILPNGTISGRKETINNVFNGDEILFKHDNVMSLAFNKNSSEYLTIWHFDDPTTKI